MQSGKQRSYSITSSAREQRVGLGAALIRRSPSPPGARA
jgi:hypothetical protein